MIVQRAARMLPVDSIYLLYFNLFLAALWGVVVWVVGGCCDAYGWGGEKQGGYGFLGVLYRLGNRFGVLR